MRRVAIVNGLTRSGRYNNHLAKLYQAIGITNHKEYQFNRALLFCCHAHGLLDNEIAQIVADNDVIHCQSGSFFRVLHYFSENKINKPLILESPVLRANTGTLLAALGRVKSYSDVKNESILVKTLLDTACFTPSWTSKTLSLLKEMKDKDQVLVLHGNEDGVSDIRGLESYFNMIWQRGAHARLFDGSKGCNNDFDFVKHFVDRHSR